MLKVHNMQAVGLGNTSILTDYAQKSPQTPIQGVMIYIYIYREREINK